MDDRVTDASATGELVMVEVPDVIDTPLQRAGQDAYHRWHQRSQIVRPVACRKHDDDRERQVVLVLLMREPAVYGEQRVKSAICGQAEQRAVPDTGPCHLRDGADVVGGRKGRP